MWGSGRGVTRRIQVVVRILFSITFLSMFRKEQFPMTWVEMNNHNWKLHKD